MISYPPPTESVHEDPLLKQSLHNQGGDDIQKDGSVVLTLFHSTGRLLSQAKVQSVDP